MKMEALCVNYPCIGAAKYHIGFVVYAERRVSSESKPPVLASAVTQVFLCRRCLDELTLDRFFDGGGWEVLEHSLRDTERGFPGRDCVELQIGEIKCLPS